MNATASPVLTPDICELLRAEAFTALKSLPKRGAEIGGFLTKSARSAEEFFADGAEFVACEHLFGPSYHLSPTDKELFRKQVESAEQTPVGYFRSCTRLETRVEPEDLEVLRTAIPGGSLIVLLKAFPNGNCELRIFAGENLDLVSEFELQMNLAAIPEEKPAEAPSVAPPNSALPWPIPSWSNPSSVPLRMSAWETAREIALPDSKQFYSRWLIYVGAGALITVLAITVAVVASRRRSPFPSAASAPSPLGMQVERQVDNFHVTWNRNLPALRNATGTLTIDDGRQTRELQLDSTQIAGGSVVYVSDGGDLTFRMQAHREGAPPLAESVRVVVALRSPPTDRGATTGQTAVPATGALAEKKERSIVPEVRAWASAIPRIAGYRPATPVRRIKPEIPASQVRRSSVVEVMVRVDAAGRVAEAHAVATADSLPESLSTQVIDATKQWTFKPAKVRGRGVPSDFTIVYSFSPLGL